MFRLRCVILFCVDGDDTGGGGGVDASGVLGISSATDLFAAPSAARSTHAVSEQVSQSVSRSLHDTVLP